MGKRYSRLSSDDGRRERRAPLPSSYEKTRCPSCCQLELFTVNVDGELPISICDGCNRMFGVDDSMDTETLAMLLADEEFCQDVQIMAVTCDRCLNNDAYCFEIVEQDSDRQALRVRCNGCSNIISIPLKDLDADRSENGYDAVISEFMGNVNGLDEDDGGSLWSDGDSGYFVDSDDDHDFGGCKDVDTGLDVRPFSCQCGNNEVDCFQEHFDVASGDIRVTCLVCDHEKVVEAFFGIECWHCGNGNKDLFERCVDDCCEQIMLLRCLVCDKRLLLPEQTPAPKKKRMEKAHLDKVPSSAPKSGHMQRQVSSGVGLGWTKIADLRHIQRGDHIAWHKWYAIWHHAVVVDVPAGGRTLTVIHYSGDFVKLDGHLASVRQETLDVNPNKEDLYRVDYPPGDSYPVEEVVQRARSRLREAKYNPFTNNCEHFARWCKTGRAECGQLRKFKDRLALAGRSAATKATQEVVASGLESSVAGSLSKLGLSTIRQRAGDVFGASSGVVRNVKCGGLACSIVINLAMEAAVFTKDAVVAYRKYKSGAISRDDFRRQLSKLGCECTGGLIGGSVAGIVGQILIPVPLLGGALGCTLGSLIGRFTGAVIGKQLAAIKH